MKYHVYRRATKVEYDETRSKLGRMSSYWNGEFVQIRYFHFFQWLRRKLGAIAVLLVTASLLFSSTVLRADSGNVGIFTLVSTQITIAVTSEALTPIDSLDGMTAASLVANFAYGSGGSTASVTIQTTLDGTNWYDVARFDFTTSTRIAKANLSGLTAEAAGTYSSLASEGITDGLLGNQFRAVLTTVGIYSNTTLSVAVAVR